MSKFGQKEPWMEPMNRFLSAATPEFKRFIDEICSWDPTQNVHHEPQYQAAVQVKPRLSPLSREGLPVLPFLLDAPKSMATLIDLWVDNAPSNIVDTGIDECVQNFHKTCLRIRQRTQDCMATAEGAQEPNTELEAQWQRMLSEQPSGRFIFNPFESITGDNDITALPQTPDVSHAQQHRSIRRDHSEHLSAAERRNPGSMSRLPNRTVTDPGSASSRQFAPLEGHQVRPGPRSRDGTHRPRFLDIYSPRGQEFMNGDMI